MKMIYNLPHYIISANIDTSVIDYKWDAYSVGEYIDYNYADEIIAKIDAVSLRAKICLMTGVYEWVIGRLYSICRDPIFFSMAEAAWCANINRFYLIPQSEYYRTNYIDMERYRGPVDGVLWCTGQASLFCDLYVSDNTINTDNSIGLFETNSTYYLDAWREDLRFLVAIVIHILPDDKLELFKRWIVGVSTRLVDYYTMKPEGVFDNLFGHEDDKDWLGDYVAREVLDLNLDYDPEQAIPLLNKFLSQVDYKSNPLLAPIDKLSKYIKTPYFIDG